jgi:hypothetical protein
LVEVTVSTTSLQKAVDYPARYKRAVIALTGLAGERRVSANDLRQNRLNIGGAFWNH